MFESARTTIVNCRDIGVTSPTTTVVIDWIAVDTPDGSAGQLCCEAWRGQFEIDRLERDGYRVTGISTL